MNMLPVTVYKGDTIPVINLRDVFIYSKTFSSKRKEKEFWRKVRDVRKTLPLAHEIRGIIIETYEFQQTLPDDTARDKPMTKQSDELRAHKSLPREATSRVLSGFCLDVRSQPQERLRPRRGGCGDRRNHLPDRERAHLNPFFTLTRGRLSMPFKNLLTDIFHQAEFC